MGAFEVRIDGVMLFSKLTTQKWPRMSSIKRNLKDYLEGGKENVKTEYVKQEN